MALGSPLNKRFVCSAWLFVRLLGFTYFCAFVSYGMQLQGLIGSTGVLPAHLTMTYVGRSLGDPNWFQFPTLCWWWVSDFALHAQWVFGALLGCLLMLGILPQLCLVLLWILYLSLVVVGRDFTAFQWDNLLLETGLLAVFLCAPVLWHRRKSMLGARPVIVSLYAWLLFRVMFSSGLGKFITSNDPSWDNLTALSVHFETQPLPTWFGYYWHQLPRSFHSFSCLVVMLAQVFLPFLLFGPSWARRIGVITIFSFQILIALTGNYGFFNLNTLIICLLLVDDEVFQKTLGYADRFFPSTIQTKLRDFFRPMLSSQSSESVGVEPKETKPLRYRLMNYSWNLLLISFVVVYFVASTIVMLRTARVEVISQETSRKILSPLSSYRSINSYGLFVVMTTSRNEIIVQGSEDGKSWKDYEFKYKPGQLSSKPEFMAPHMPRLDWQMWFAALGKVQQNRWFTAFVRRLLEGNESVLDLLAHNPFPDKPPRFIRALKYDYRFTDLDAKSKNEHWWSRIPNGTYMPIQALP